jgi:hypothetical protein
LHAAAHQQKMMAEMMQQAMMAPPQGAPGKPAPTHAPEAATSVQKKSTPPGAVTV